MADAELSDAKQRVLDSAETLFMQRGYNAITLRDIAEDLGLRQASLYYHFPSGKEQLYVEVAERAFARHRTGLRTAIAAADDNLADQLRAIGAWFETQPSMNLAGMMHADMPALSREQAHYLGRVAYDCLFQPIRDAFCASTVRGETRLVNPDVLTGMFLAILDGMSFTSGGMERPSRHEMMEEVISVLLDGLRVPVRD